MIALDMLAAPAFLEKSRWFGGKGAPIAHVRAIDEAQLTPGLVFVTLEVSYSGQRPPERYVVPLKPNAGWSEGLADDAAAQALFELVRSGKSVKTARGELRGERFGNTETLAGLGPAPAVRRLSAEQSNTSLVFGDRVILKLIRKLEQGVNPELEMGAFLGKHGFKATPELLGALTLHGALDATAAVAHRFVQVESDGWSYVLKGLGTPAMLADLRELGARVGEMHVALASDGADPAFAPEPVTRDDLQRLAATLEQELRRTLEVAAKAVPELHARSAALSARIARLANAEPQGVRIRQHGDLHLGQVLRTGGQWLIFDFEGEPARPFRERRAKSSPMKDVAGMLRSLAYAAATVKKPEALQPARAAFLDGWRSVAAQLVPGDSALMLQSLELEKLMYELRYEVGHRPDWVAIPANDLLALA